MNLFKTIGAQFRQPSGLLGKIISKIMQKGNSPAYDKIIDMLQIKDGDNLFEIGYGHGLGIERILSKAECTITGIDFSELMFKEATKRNKKHIENKKVNLLYENFLEYQPELEKFDKVYCLNVIYFWDELEKPFYQIKRMLKPKGTFCMFMEHRDALSKYKIANNVIFNKYPIEYIEKMLKNAGFEKVYYNLENGYFIKASL